MPTSSRAAPHDSVALSGAAVAVRSRGRLGCRSSMRTNKRTRRARAPDTLSVSDPRRIAREFINATDDDVRSLKFEPGAVVVETGKPDAFYARLTELAASGQYGAIEEVTSPDDNLQAVFQYLVK